MTIINRLTDPYWRITGWWGKRRWERIVGRAYLSRSGTPEL